MLTAAEIIRRLKAANPQIADHRFIFRNEPTGAIVIVDVDRPDAPALVLPASLVSMLEHVAVWTLPMLALCQMVDVLRARLEAAQGRELAGHPS